MTNLFCPPDLSTRPLRMNITCTLAVPPATVFAAWTKHLDRWLAAPGTILVTPAVNTAFYFETHHETADGLARQPYYGRFLRLVRDELIELTWLSTGTQHTETVITIGLTAVDAGTQVKLTHAGFPNQELMQAHETAWPMFLQQIVTAFA